MKKSFVRYISHELRTPLNTVDMGLQLLKTEVLKRPGGKDDDIMKIVVCILVFIYIRNFIFNVLY